MISVQSAAGVVAGMIQSTRAVGPQWDTLPPEEIAKFIACWQRTMADTPGEAPNLILASISNHPILGAAWNSLDPSVRQSRMLVIRAIVSNIE